MASIFRPTTVSDEPGIVDLLTRVFLVGRDASFVSPPLLRWKYWDPRADCPEPRSLVMEKNGRIVAHVGLWPVTIRTATKVERGVHMIDWASDLDAPGAGVSLLQRLTKTYDFVYAIGGTDITQSILPKFGFKVVATALTFARPIRPWRQLLQHPRRDARLPLRFVRNLLWSWTPIRVRTAGWSAEPAEAGDVAGLAALARERDGEFFRYLQRCPAARFQWFHLLSGGSRSGMFALSVVGKQARLAGLWLEEPVSEHWRTAFNLAQDAALRHTAASELVTRTSTEISVPYKM